MNEVIRFAKEAVVKEEIQELAKILARYNLGICIPHMHNKQTGELVPLSTGMVSCERNLNVSFEEATVMEDQGMVAVAWRWNGTNMEICANCCTFGD